MKKYKLTKDDIKGLIFMQGEIKKFIDENTGILKAMTHGYKFTMWFKQPKVDDKYLKIMSEVTKPDGEKITIEDLFK